MKTIKLGWQSRNKNPFFVMVDDEDFDWITKHHWHVFKHAHTFYARRLTLDRKTIFMHREILGITDPKILSDHEDHNGLNNQKNNLRISNSCQNNSNRRSFKKSTSKYKGVCWHKKRQKWRAIIGVNKTQYNIGFFNTEIEAAIAYNEEAKKVHGIFACLNKVA